MTMMMAVDRDTVARWEARQSVTATERDRAERVTAEVADALVGTIQDALEAPEGVAAYCEEDAVRQAHYAHRAWRILSRAREVNVTRRLFRVQAVYTSYCFNVQVSNPVPTFLVEGDLHGLVTEDEAADFAERMIAELARVAPRDVHVSVVEV